MIQRIPFRAAILVVCALVVTGLWLAQANPYLNPADDSGRYMVLGESLARTGELRLINDVRQIRDTLYVPGLPALIAFWLKATGRDPGAVVLPIKATLLLLLLGTLPLFLTLLERARLRRTTVAAAMIAYAACPAMISYANEVMSEMPLLFLCLASLVLATTEGKTSASRQIPDREEGRGKNEESLRPPSPITGYPRPNAQHFAIFLASVGCAVLAYYVRAVGVVLLFSLMLWFWRSRGWRSALATLFVTLVVVGTWQMRTSRIIAQDPPNIPHDTYMKQFTLRNPDDPNAGRIQSNLLGIGSRIKRCFLPNIYNIPRAVLFSMSSKGSPWQALFYVIAVPFTVLTLYGWFVAWHRGMVLVCGFCVLFWLFVALWPWISPRFLVPLVPYILLFVFCGADSLDPLMDPATPPVVLRTVSALAMGLLLAYYANIHALVIRREHAPTLPGHALGRSREESGFYAAASWLRGREPAGVVMARPAYLMHLYSGHPTTQIEPSTNPRVQELAYMVPNHVRFLVADAWTWSHTENYLPPYLRTYGRLWILVWQDPGESGVRIYRRNNDASPEPHGTPSGKSGSRG